MNSLIQVIFDYHRKDKKMILSIHGGHNASASLITKKDGEIKSWCIEAERVDRIKMSLGCERYEGSDFSSSTKSEWLSNKKSNFSLLLKRLFSEARITEADVDIIVISQNTDISRIPEKLNNKYIIKIPHHLAHAALSFYTSNFKEALVVVCDGEGELTDKGYETQTAWKFDNKGYTKLMATYKKDHYEMGIANAYEIYTYWLGYGYNGCGTTMALASFSNEHSETADNLFVEDEYNNIFVNKSIIDLQEHVKKLNYVKKGTMAFNQEHEKMMRSISLPPKYKLRYSQESSINNDFIMMAADIQYATEKAVISYIENARKILPSNFICMGGGTFLNCNLNSKIREMSGVKDIHVPTAPGDGGLSLGAALAYYFSYNERCKVADTAFIGCNILPIKPNDSDNIAYKKITNISQKAAELIVEGNLIGWCQGRAEFGPRALGNRSLLADPRTMKSHIRINEKLKHREAFRPFAPIVLEKYYSECFEGVLPIPYMLETRKIKEHWRAKIPAVCHIDNSARVQIVNSQNSPKLNELIEAFYRLTGVPVLINTSLNRNGEPIVNDAVEAIELLRKGMLDYLIIGDYLYFQKEKNNI